jgi:hypothetical protein
MIHYDFGFDPAWINQKFIYLPIVTANQTNINVYVWVSYDPSMNADFSDIRFTDEDGTTLLSYFISPFEYTAGQKAVFIVKVPALTAKIRKFIVIYYGNAAAASLSNGAATCAFFDDFTGGLGAWSINAGVSVVGTTLTLPAINNYARTTATFPGPHGAEFRAKFTMGTGQYAHMAGFFNHTSGIRQVKISCNTVNPLIFDSFDCHYITRTQLIQYQRLDFNGAFKNFRIEKNTTRKGTLYLNNVFFKSIENKAGLFETGAENFEFQYYTTFVPVGPKIEVESPFLIYKLPQDGTPWPVLQLSGDVHNNLT